jgi:hypothetical protein
MNGKNLSTDVERVICLGYCLDHICGVKEFAPQDLNRLNNDLGLRPFSNPSLAVRKARIRGLFELRERHCVALTTDGNKTVESLPTRSG